MRKLVLYMVAARCGPHPRRARVVYVPEKGEKVRIVEVDPDDGYPDHKVGDVVVVENARLSCIEPGYIQLNRKGSWTGSDLSGTFCKVEFVEGIERVPPPFMSTDSATRKLMPVATGFLRYFPDAVMLQAWVSRVGNEKHNPGEPIRWAKEKSADEPDAEVRHMLDGFRGLPPDPGLEPLAHLGHLASKAWRANADLQRACDEARAAYERGEEWRK